MAECPVCGHSAPDTCLHCGGKYGYPPNQYPQTQGPCQSCNFRGPTPAEMAAKVQSYLMCHPEELALLDLGGMSLGEWLETHPEQVAAWYELWNLG